LSRRCELCPPPADGKAQSKVLDRETVHFCSKHAKWGGHLESACRKPDISDTPPPATAAAEKEKKKKTRLPLSQALAAVMKDMKDYDYDSANEDDDNLE
jgi:hypothetical protein